MPATLSQRVVVIVRTKGRPRLLQRALSSIGRQSFTGFAVVVVYDGPTDPASLEIVMSAQRRGMALRLIEQPPGLGIEAASNAGIAATQSDYIAIHDDDDTWAPDFLEACVDLLTSAPKFGGAITHCFRVIEEITAEDIRELQRVPLWTRLRAVSLLDLAMENLFPPISFLIKRSIYDTIGGFDEELRMLGDWDFNLRFLMTADIGVVPKPLASQHLRATVGTSDYANLLGGDALKYIEHSTILRNKYLRSIDSNHLAALGIIMGLSGAVNAASLTRPASTEISQPPNGVITRARH